MPVQQRVRQQQQHLDGKTHSVALCIQLRPEGDFGRGYSLRGAVADAWVPLSHPYPVSSCVPAELPILLGGGPYRRHQGGRVNGILLLCTHQLVC